MLWTTCLYKGHAATALSALSLSKLAATPAQNYNAVTLAHHTPFLSITPFATHSMPSSMHICASPTPWATLTTTSIPHSHSKPRFLSVSSSTPTSVTGASFSYLSAHETPSIHVPLSDVRHTSREKVESDDDFSILSEPDVKLQSTAFSSTQAPSRMHDDASAATTLQLDAYALPPPNTQPRFIFKMQNIEYVNEDTTDSESISDVGHPRQLPPPRIYFHESRLTYVPPFCSDVLPRDPDIKGVPRNYRSWTRAGRPRLEVDGATRNEAKSDFSSIGLAWHGSGNGDTESDGDLSDEKGDDKDKRRRKKKKLATRRNAISIAPIERPKRTVRRIAEADGQLRIVAGSTVASFAAGSALEKMDRANSSRAQSLTQSSLPSSRAQSPAKRRKSNKLHAGAERKAEVDAQAEDEERDADGSEEDDLDADGEVDPDALVLQSDNHSINAVLQNHGTDGADTIVPMAVEVPVPGTANKALSESSSVTLIDAGSADDVDDVQPEDKRFVENSVAQAVSKSVKASRKRKRPTGTDHDENAEDKTNEVNASSPSKKARLSRRSQIKGRTKELKESNHLNKDASTPSRNTRSAGTTPLTKLRSRPIRRSAGKSESTPLERVHQPSRENLSDRETEEEQESEQDDDKDETFLPRKPSDGSISTGLKALRTPKAKLKSSTKIVSTVEISQPPSSRSSRTKKRRGSSPSGPFEVTNSSGSESKGNGVTTSVSISRPHHRASQPTAPAIPIPMRTFEPPVSIIEGYTGFYRRYPLILQFDASGNTAEAGSPSKKGVTFGDMEKYILDGVSRDLVPNPKRPLGNFNPPRDIRDLYTPRYTKGSGGKKLALCPICFEDPRRGGEGRQEWNHTKTSQHNYHMQYYHGISASRFQPFSPPVAHRVVQVPRPQSNEKPEILQGRCHHCKQWIPLEGCKVGELKVKELFWWKHAACCHKDSKLPGDSDAFIEDEAYRRLLEYEAEHGIDPEASSATASSKS